MTTQTTPATHADQPIYAAITAMADQVSTADLHTWATNLQHDIDSGTLNAAQLPVTQAAHAAITDHLRDRRADLDA